MCAMMLLVSYGLCSRQRALYYLVNFMMLNFASAFLKLRAHEPRPFWVGEGSEAIRCSGEYGSPSGHSSTSMHITIVCLLDWATEEGMEAIGQVMTCCAGIIIPFLVGVSRLYVGVHSFD